MRAYRTTAQPEMSSSANAVYNTLHPSRYPSSNTTMASHEVPPAGSCVMRLQGIENMSHAAKAELLRSISNDLRALLMCIGQHVESASLDSQTTAPLDEVITIIRDTEAGYRRSLERELRQSRKEERWMRREYRGVVRSMGVLARAYRAKVLALKGVIRELQMEMADLKAERGVLQTAAVVENAGEEGGDADADA